MVNAISCMVLPAWNWTIYNLLEVVADGGVFPRHWVAPEVRR